MLRAARRPDPLVRRVSAAVLACGLVVGCLGGSSLWWRSRHVVVPLLSDTVAVTADGGRTLLLPGDGREVVPGTRVLTSPDAADADRTRAAVRAEQAWLRSGTIPGDGGPYGPMVRGALLDLHALTLESGATIASGAPSWRFVWPRDASFTAAALARTGHVADAVRVLEFLQQQQSADGSLQARYLPDGSGPPDDRGLQEDGPGWALWAVSRVVDAQRAADRPATLRTLQRLIDRSGTRLLALTADGTELPPPSADYWEVAEDSLTLGTVAPMLAGLSAAARLHDVSGQTARSDRMARASASLTALVEDGFGSGGYHRYRGGDAVDAAVTFVLPPFQRAALRGAQRVWDRAVPRMQRGGGGVAPGEGWKQDGISWTPETALFALTGAAVGRTDQAQRWLTWLAAHRTPSGSLPEKVLSDGSPAAVSPLGWTSAVVVLAVAELEAR